MLKRFAILAATLAAVAISLVGAQEAWATNPVLPADGPSAQPTASATPAGTAHDDMAGMDHEKTAPVDQEQTAPADQEQMDGMSEDEMAGMDHGDEASATPRNLPARRRKATAATPVPRQPRWLGHSPQSLAASRP